MSSHDLQLQSVSPQACDYLAQCGFDPVYGARPLQRVLKKELLAPLSKMLIDGRIRDGESLSIDLNPDTKELVFHSSSNTSDTTTKKADQ